MPTTRFDHCNDTWESREDKDCHKMQVERCRSDDDLVVIFEIDSYSSYGGSFLEERYFFLSKKEAIELAKFILEQYGERG